MALMQVHNHLAFAFGVIGNIISFFVYLAPVETFYKICKDKSTREFQSVPYLVALFSSTLWLYYGLLKPDADLLIAINSVGCLVELIYIVIYIRYANRNSRKSTIRIFVAMNVACFAMILLVTKFAIYDPVLRFKILGWICDIVSIGVFAAPLSIVAQVVRTKSVQYMPLSLSLFLTISAIIWFFYGLFLKNPYIAIPNVLGFILGMLQLVLYAFYKNETQEARVIAL